MLFFNFLILKLKDKVLFFNFKINRLCDLLIVLSTLAIYKI